MRRALGPLLLAALLLASAPVVQGADQTVTVTNAGFSPSAVTIDVGEQVTWSFQEGFHNVVWDTSGAPANCPDNGPCARTFPTAGTYSYHCQYHGFMTGSVTVNAPPPANVAPVAAFTATPNGLAVSVNAAASTDNDGSIVGYAWAWGDGSAAGSGQGASHTYASGGTYTITLTVTDDDGATDSESKQVTVSAPNQAPVASFTLSVTHLTAHVDASASSDADGSIASYAWSWGDGATGMGPTASHTYAAAGTYAIQLTVTDDDGASATQTKQAAASAPPATTPTPTPTPTPANRPPTAAFTFEVDHLTVRVDASGSADDDGNVVAWSWAWGDGNTSAGNATQTHAYAQPGAMTIRLTVTDDDGATGPVEHVVTIRAPDTEPPTAAFVVLQDGLGVRVNGSLSHDEEGEIVEYLWDWGDGRSGGPGAEAAHAYAALGTFVITLTVVDESGNEGRASQTVELTTVAGAAPDVRFSYRMSGRSLEATSLATDADGDIALYAWAFGDGTTTSGEQVTHTYRARGTYLVRHEVTDAAGRRAAFEQEVTTPPNLAPPGNVTVTREGFVVTLRTDARDPDGEVANLSWDFGDGSAPAFGPEATHPYARDDTFRVTLTIVDDEGATTLVEQEVTIAPTSGTRADPAPAPKSEGDAIPGAGVVLVLLASALVALARRR